MPLDVQGCMHATLTDSMCAYLMPAGTGNLLKRICNGDQGLQLFSTNEEFPLSMGHKLVLIKSLPFLHTVHHCYPLNLFPCLQMAKQYIPLNFVVRK